MKIILDTAKKLNVKPEKVFKLAFEYYEERVPKCFVIEIYQDWLYKHEIHDTVYDFCVETLAGRVQQCN